jgi:hypothetical protein
MTWLFSFSAKSFYFFLAVDFLVEVALAVLLALVAVALVAFFAVVFLAVMSIPCGFCHRLSNANTVLAKGIIYIIS